MNPFDHLLLRFLLASLGCLAAGLSVWALGAVLRRYLPALSMQRSMWLLAQATVLATFVLILLPHSERVRLLPPIEDATESVSEYFTPAAATAGNGNNGTALAASSRDDATRPWLLVGAQAWLAVYLLGLAVSAVRLWRGQRMLDRLAGTGHALDRSGGHAGLAGMQGVATVIEVDAPISPMLLGPLRPRLLLPRHLRKFDSLQQELIVDHELTHLRRHDLHWMTAGVLLQTLLWFNPFMRLLRKNLNWAQELGCDRDVLRNRPVAQRKAYAAALVAQLKMQHCAVNTALAFGSLDPNSVAERMSLIRTPGRAARTWWARGATVAGLAAIVVGNFALQPALAWNVEPGDVAKGPLHCLAFSDATSGRSLHREGFFGVRVTPVSTFNIAVSLMGYDSGFLRDEHAPTLPYREGYAAWNPAWRSDKDPASWIRDSVVWYAQQVTTHLGEARFAHYVKSFGYGNQDTAGDPGKANGLTHAWIGASLKISADEQVAFLSRVANRTLPVSAHAHDMTARLLKVASLPGGWEVYGKTGTGAPVGANGKDDYSRSYGWFVGWATNGQRTIAFAYLNQDQQLTEGAAGPRARQAFLEQLPARLAAL